MGHQAVAVRAGLTSAALASILRTSSAAVSINLASNTASGGDATGDVLSGVDGVFGSTPQASLSADFGFVDFVSGSEGAVRVEQTRLVVLSREKLMAIAER